MSTIGVLGGGQLAWMLGIAAKELGHRIYVLDPNADCPASNIADKIIVANYDDEKGLKELAWDCDVVTYEFENVPAESIKIIEETCPIPQGYEPLHISQNRIREKNSAVLAGIPTPKFKRVTSKDELLKAIDEIGLPAILKTTEGGYDGKGQVVIKSMDDIVEVNCESILEEKIDFDYEISCIVVRNKKGQTITFPLSRNTHKNGILHIGIVPGDIDKKVEKKAKEIAIKYMKKMKFVGILAIEMFVKGEQVYFNEMAPRPHNSGHYTIDGCTTSQYKELIKAVLNAKLIEPEIIYPTVMVNILGQNMKYIKEIEELPFRKSVYLYNKTEERENRKMGHVTFIDTPLEDIKDSIERYFG